MIRFMEGIIVGVAGTIVGLEQMIDTIQYIVERISELI